MAGIGRAHSCSANRRGSSALVYALAALVAAGLMLTFAAQGAGPLPGDLATTRGLQGLLPEGIVGLSPTFVGGVVWFLPVAVVALALVLRRWSDAVFVVLAGGTGLLVGYVLKFLVARPRPPVEFARVVDEGYGFPSTTTLFAVVLLGTVCYLVRGASRPIFVSVLAGSIVMAAVVGLSRVYAGEHWATDVLGSYLFGLAWMIVLIPVHRRWLESPPRSRR